MTERHLITMGARTIEEVDGVELSVRDLEALTAAFKCAVNSKDHFSAWVHMNTRDQGNYFTVGIVSRAMNRTRHSIKSWYEQSWEGDPPPRPTMGVFYADDRGTYLYTEADVVRLSRWMRRHGIARTTRKELAAQKRAKVRKKRQQREMHRQRRIKIIRMLDGEIPTEQ